MSNREQKLVDLCFEMVLTVTDERYGEWLKDKSKEEIAHWVQDQLRQCGFDTIECGASWGRLRK